MPDGNCSCGQFKPNMCTSWHQVNQSYIDGLVEGDVFQCAYDWPPWPSHLTPQIHNSPPGFANPRDGFSMWHDVAAALTLAGPDGASVTHHVWMGTYPCEMVMLSRFVALTISLTLKVSLLQTVAFKATPTMTSLAPTPGEAPGRTRLPRTLSTGRIMETASAV